MARACSRRPSQAREQLLKRTICQACYRRAGRGWLRRETRFSGETVVECRQLRCALPALGSGLLRERDPVLIALMVLCCDPLAIALTAAASARH